MALRGALLFFLLENSKWLTEWYLWRQPYVRDVIEKLKDALPFFTVDYIVVSCDKLFPHHRDRIFIRGMRNDVMASHTIPAPLASIGEARVKLKDILLRGLPNIKVGDMTSRKQVQNCPDYGEQIQRDVISGKAPRGSIAVFDINRGFNKA
jgi:site-specific DNA-cytosine methylase